MLQSLRIRHFAIIDELEIDFGEGLNVITGETGAGKTILLHALSQLLGAKASPDLVRQGCVKAQVSAVFAVDPQSPILPLLHDMGIGFEEELVLQRLIDVSGKGKSTINGVPATNQMLRSLAPYLIDVSSQHEHQLLIDPTAHASILDRFGDLRAQAEAYQGAYAACRRISAERDAMRAQLCDVAARVDFLTFQYEELKRAALKVGEEEALISERERSKHGVVLEEKIREAESGLTGEAGSALSTLRRALQCLAHAERFDAALTPWRETVARCEVELAEVARDLSRHAAKLNTDPARLAAIEDRLHQLRGLTKKYGGSVEACLTKLASCEAELHALEQRDDLLQQKEDELGWHHQALRCEGAAFAKERRKVAKLLSQQIERELVDLAMAGTAFDIQCAALPFESWTSDGPEAVEFFIAPNVGEGKKPLAAIASGGELSRVLLAVKRALADRANLALTYLFDEIDAGIGGTTALAVGKKLKEVSRCRQVICITHLPQVAAAADVHFNVSKEACDGRTTTRVTALATKDAQIEELARMLGGGQVVASARAHAARLLAAD